MTVASQRIMRLAKKQSSPVRSSARVCGCDWKRPKSDIAKVFDESIVIHHRTPKYPMLQGAAPPALPKDSFLEPCMLCPGGVGGSQRMAKLFGNGMP